MKKSLFLIATIFSVFFITDRVNAQTFTVAGEEREVTEENLIYYCYSLFPDLLKYDYIMSFVHKDSTMYYCSSSTGKSTISNETFYFTGPSGSMITNFLHTKSIYRFDSNFNNTTNTLDTSSSSLASFSYSRALTSNFDFIPWGTTSLPTNYTFVSKQDILDYFQEKTKYIISFYVNDKVYKEIEVEEGSSYDYESISYNYNQNTHIFSGWEVSTEDVDFSNISKNIEIKATLTEKEIYRTYVEFPIDKNEFYVLLVEVGVLIMIIFLKWCFPFKGGSDLK